MGWKLRFKKSDDAVSQMMSTSMLLVIGLAITSMIYSYYLSYPPPNSPPNIDIVGTLEERTRYLTAIGDYEEDCDIILTHRGGESLPTEDEVLITIGDNYVCKIIGECLDSESKKDGLWNIGERLIFTAEDITNYQLYVSIYDISTQYILFQAVFQKNTYITTQSTFDVQHNGATLCMDYDFKEHLSGKVRFAYKNQSEPDWSYTPWIPRSGRDFYHKRVEGLSCTTMYLFKGEIKYNDIIESGNVNSFITNECP